MDKRRIAFLGMSSPTLYNLGLETLIETTKQGFPPPLTPDADLPSRIYEPCRCITGARFAELMQDTFLNNGSLLSTLYLISPYARSLIKQGEQLSEIVNK